MAVYNRRLKEAPNDNPERVQEATEAMLLDFANFVKAEAEKRDVGFVLTLNKYVNTPGATGRIAVSAAYGISEKDSEDDANRLYKGLRRTNIRQFGLIRWLLRNF